MAHLVQELSRQKLRTSSLFVLSSVSCIILTIFLCGFLLTQPESFLPRPKVTHLGPPDFFERELRTRMIAPVQVALVFGRAPGCQDIDASLINLVAREAVRAGVYPKLLASIVAVESQCDPLAVSSRGALGLTQVMPHIWDARFDFSRVNLLNPGDNVHTGAIILADLIREHGLCVGLQRYNGATAGCLPCDRGYSVRVLALAGIKARGIKARIVKTRTGPRRVFDRVCEASE